MSKPADFASGSGSSYLGRREIQMKLMLIVGTGTRADWCSENAAPGDAARSANGQSRALVHCT